MQTHVTAHGLSRLLGLADSRDLCDLSADGYDPVIQHLVIPDPDFAEAREAFHAVLERMGAAGAEWELRDALESAFNLAYGRAARAVARVWLGDLSAVPA